MIFDRSSPHYRDQLDNDYLREAHFDAPYLIPEIVCAVKAAGCSAGDPRRR